MPADGYLARLENRIRRVSGEVWADDTARRGVQTGLVLARELYLREPGAPARPFAEGLAEVLGPDFTRPAHDAGCVPGHRHGRAGCMQRGCNCRLKAAQPGDR